MNAIEVSELLEKLSRSGYGRLVEVMLQGESYRKTGRLNVTFLAKEMKTTIKAVHRMLASCRALLTPDMG